jgi:hypothetical protein
MEKTPKQIKIELKERLQAVLLSLPPYFINTFLHVYPQYKEQRNHIYNVSNGRSLDEHVIEKFEALATLLNTKVMANVNNLPKNNTTC